MRVTGECLVFIYTSSSSPAAVATRQEQAVAGAERLLAMLLCPLLFFPKTTEEAVYPVTAERVCDA